MEKRVISDEEINNIVFYETIPSGPESEDEQEDEREEFHDTFPEGINNFLDCGVTDEFVFQNAFDHDYCYENVEDQGLDNVLSPQESSVPPTNSVGGNVVSTEEVVNVDLHVSSEPIPSTSSEIKNAESIEDYALQPPKKKGKLQRKSNKQTNISKNVGENAINELEASENKNNKRLKRNRRILQQERQKSTKEGPATRPGPTWNQNEDNIPSMSGVLDQYAGVSDLILEMEDHEPVNLFKTMITDKIIEDIVFQTNLYAEQSGKRYVPTNKKEIEVFIGINLLMGIKKMPSYRDYWSTDMDMNDPFISNLMSVNRFGWLLSNLHLNDNNFLPARDNPDYDKLYKLRPFLDEILSNFKKNFHPGQILSVDESMIRFKGRSSLKQFMPKKPIKRGYKLWMLADKSGYVLHFEVYTGKVGNARQYDLGPTVVKRLTEDIQGKHHCVFLDNYFVSYFLMEDLKEAGINACGTVNVDRKHLPDFKISKDMERGEHQFFVSDNNIAAIKWIDNRPVHLLTNCHDPRLTILVKRREKSGQRINVTCPEAIKEYNLHMNCVDKFDQLKTVYEINRKSHKWWHRIFFYFLDASVINAFVLHKCLPGVRRDLKTFRRKIVLGLVGERWSQAKSATTRQSDSPRPNQSKPNIPMEVRLAGSHQPSRNKRRRCAMCSTKEKQVSTFWFCEICNVPLCLGKNKDCFQKFHLPKK